SLGLLKLVTDADCVSLPFSKDDVLTFCNQCDHNDDSRVEDVERYKPLIEIIRNRKETVEQTKAFVARELKSLQQTEAQRRLQLYNESNSVWKESGALSNINQTIWINWIREHVEMNDRD